MVSRDSKNGIEGTTLYVKYRLFTYVASNLAFKVQLISAFYLDIFVRCMGCRIHEAAFKLEAKHSTYVAIRSAHWRKKI